jgi:type VI secretion system secreted protein VgrG
VFCETMCALKMQWVNKDLSKLTGDPTHPKSFIDKKILAGKIVCLMCITMMLNAQGNKSNWDKLVMTRTFILHSPLDADALRFVHLNGKEALSTVSEFDLQCVSPSPDIEATDLLGKSATIEIATQDGSSRFLNGIVTQFSYVGPDGSAGLQYKYRARLNSWLYLADKHADCKIYQQKNIPAIIREALQDFEMPFEIKLMDSYAPREYVVMYNETTLNFVKRLAEEAGIYFYTRHADGSHVICFTDGGHPTLPEYATIPFLTPNQRTLDAEEYISEWEVQHEVHSGRYVTSSYNFKTPDAHLDKIDLMPKEHTFDALETYEWHGGYPDHDEGAKLARVRREQQQLDFQTINARSNVRGIAPGYLFKLTDHPTRKSNAEYLIVSALYQFQENPDTSRSDGEYTHWALDFTVKPSGDRYQPPRITSKPKVSGPHSAKISGPAGADHWCDKWGRVKVQFPWDRYGKNDENSSCWIRVSTPSAGSNFGGIHVPRIGHEVIVEYLNGDPDLPIITGSVYNQNQMPPWDLPANASQSGFISRSLGKSHIGNANALRFEDKKGQEQVWIQAERNMDTAVENDETHHVMHDRTKNVGNDETVGVQRNRAASVGNNEDVSVGNNRTKQVGQDETISIGGNRTESVTKDESISITGNRTHNIQKNLTETVTQKVTQTVGAEKTTNVIGAYTINAQDAMNRVVTKNSSEVVGQAKSTVVSKAFSVEVGQAYSVDAVGTQAFTTAKNFTTSAQQDHTLVSGQNFTIMAGSTIELACGNGGAVIKMDSAGNVTITGKKVMLSAGGGSVTLDASGAKVTGTLTYIN